MNILIFTNSDAGLYRFRKELIAKLIDKGNAVQVVCPMSDYQTDLKALGCKCIDIDIDKRGVNPLRDLKLMRAFYKILKKEKPDLVLTYTVKPNIYGNIVCKILKIKVYSNITGFGSAIEKGGLLKRFTLYLYKKALRHAQIVFVQNQDINYKCERLGVSKNKLRLIPGSGVNLSEYNFEEYPEDDGKIKLLYLGRIMKDKGVNELLEVAKKLKMEYHNVQLTLVGNCDESLLSIVNQMQTEKIIDYLGRQKDVNFFIKSHHATVLPSYHEGMSNALLESAACGRALLASNIAGCREIIEEGVNGYTFEPKNAESLYKAVKKFINLPYAEKAEMGRKSRTKTQNDFDRKLVIDSYINEIEKLGDKNV